MYSECAKSIDISTFLEGGKLKEENKKVLREKSEDVNLVLVL